jgi:hypothetical protein
MFAVRLRPIGEKPKLGSGTGFGFAQLLTGLSWSCGGGAAGPAELLGNIKVKV